MSTHALHLHTGCIHHARKRAAFLRLVMHNEQRLHIAAIPRQGLLLSSGHRDISGLPLVLGCGLLLGRRMRLPELPSVLGLVVTPAHHRKPATQPPITSWCDSASSYSSVTTPLATINRPVNVCVQLKDLLV